MEQESSGTKEEDYVDINQIRELVRVAEESGVGEIVVEEEGVRIAVRMPGTLSAEAAAAAVPSPVAAVAPAPAPAEAASAAADDVDRPASWYVVTAPMVGTFYTSPGPGEPPFVQVGDEVAANQTLCIVEAMKLMNEITAEEMGTVREVCLEDASPVEFGTAAVLHRTPCDPRRGRPGERIMFGKVLVANRGEVALRIMRACKELGVKTVAVYSTEDANTYPVQYADEAVCIGPAQANQSYLVMSSIIAAAKNTGAEAIHPGYGFLAENADFARACADNDLVFIGPSADCIERMGDKSMARETMKACGVPTVPGSDGCIDTAAEAKAFADSVGYPVLIKATAGGGGKGMREVHDPADLESQYQAARNEAGAAFGNDGVYLEKLVLRPRHVEIQVLADDFGNNIALCERDCSVQRRHQKLIEEAPSPALTEDLRRAMGVAAIKAVRAVDYKNAGTIEFLLDERRPVLLHGNEHARAGGTSRDRADHRHRHHQGAAAHRFRRAHAAALHRAPFYAVRPRHGVPHQRGGSGARLPPVPRHHHEVRGSVGAGRARGKLRASTGSTHFALLRFAGGEAGRVRARPRRGAPTRAPRPGRVRHRGHQDHHPVPSPRS